MFLSTRDRGSLTKIMQIERFNESNHSHRECASDGMESALLNILIPLCKFNFVWTFDGKVKGKRRRYERDVMKGSSVNSIIRFSDKAMIVVDMNDFNGLCEILGGNSYHYVSWAPNDLPIDSWRPGPFLCHPCADKIQRKGTKRCVTNFGLGWHDKYTMTWSIVVTT